MGAVQDEEVGGLGRDPQQRGRRLERLGVVAPALLQHPRGEEPVAHQLGRAQAGRAGEVVDAVVRDRARAPRCRRPRSPAARPGRRGGQRGEGGEVAAGRAAGDRDVRRVAAVVGDVLLDPRDRLLDVDDVGGERVARGEAVVDRDAHPALGGQVVHQREALLVLVADRPGAAVDLQQHRRAAVGHARRPACRRRAGRGGRGRCRRCCARRGPPCPSSGTGRRAGATGPRGRPGSAARRAGRW